MLGNKQHMKDGDDLLPEAEAAASGQRHEDDDVFTEPCAAAALAQQQAVATGPSSQSSVRDSSLTPVCGSGPAEDYLEASTAAETPRSQGLLSSIISWGQRTFGLSSWTRFACPSR